MPSLLEDVLIWTCVGVATALVLLGVVRRYRPNHQFTLRSLLIALTAAAVLSRVLMTTGVSFAESVGVPADKLLTGSLALPGAQAALDAAALPGGPTAKRLLMHWIALAGPTVALVITLAALLLTGFALNQTRRFVALSKMAVWSLLWLTLTAWPLANLVTLPRLAETQRWTQAYVHRRATFYRPLEQRLQDAMDASSFDVES